MANTGSVLLRPVDLPKKLPWYESLRRLPAADRLRLGERLWAMLHDPDRFAAAHLALWRLHEHDPELRPSMHRPYGLDVAYGPLVGALGDPRPEYSEQAAFPRPYAQMRRLRHWWTEYFRGERKAFFEIGAERPAVDVGFPPTWTDAEMHFYLDTLPPRPPQFDRMSVRELEAYYGAPPDVTDDDLWPEPPPSFRPPPIPNWREWAGLPGPEEL